MLFEKSACSTEKKLANFTKYVRRQNLARFLAQIEIFKIQLPIKGSIVECGVHQGGGVMAWAKLSTMLEPYNYHRKVIGFDTFEGFPHVAPIDLVNNPDVKKGMFSEAYDTYEELTSAINEFNENRYLSHIDKIELIKGDANLEIPKYIEKNPHILISLLYLDFDVYEPTVTALKYCLPRMPKGAVIAFDEINNPDWPGETMALLQELNLRDCELHCFEFEPNISYMVLK